MGIGIVVAVIFGLIWLGLTVSSIIEGKSHLKKARHFMSQGRWEEASLEYKLAIINRLDSRSRIKELTDELRGLYQERNVETDFSELLKCSDIIKKLGLDTGNQKKKNELMMETYQKASEIMDQYPGPKIP